MTYNENAILCDKNNDTIMKNMMKYIVNCEQNMVKYITIGEMSDKKMTIFYMTKCSDNSRHFFWLSLPLPS